MNKEVLLEPLNEAKKAYSDFFQKNEDKLDQEIFIGYINQAECIDDILAQLDSDSENKNSLIILFEKMQAYGNPPKEIMEFSRDGSFNLFD